MELPVLNGIIDRRILINYRVDADVVKKLLPQHLDPIVINGFASAGICLLRLKNIGVKYSPSIFRITSENAAHRFLIKYKEGDKEVHGVYIPRRDTDSTLNVLLAGKLFSWPHYPANFQVQEANGKYSLKMQSEDLDTSLLVEAKLSDTFPSDSMFTSVDHASECFRDCPVGISPSSHAGRFKKIRLQTKTWSVKPLEVINLRSSFYENKSLFPNGSIRFDNALLMEGIEHQWTSK